MKQENTTRQKLLEAAVRMIWQSSYGAVSVDDICAEAGVNKGSFYYAFKSKSELAVAAYEHYWETKSARMDQMFSPRLSPLERLNGFCEYAVSDQEAKFKEFGKVLGCPFCALGSELSTQDEKIRLKTEQIMSRNLKYFESMIRDLASEGLIEVRDSAELAQEVSSYILGVVMQAKIDNSLDSVRRMKHGVVRLLGIKEKAVAVA